MLTERRGAGDARVEVITLVMLFLAGFALGRHAGYRSRCERLAMAVFGAILIVAVKALGG